MIRRRTRVLDRAVRESVRTELRDGIFEVSYDGQDTAHVNLSDAGADVFELC